MLSNEILENLLEPAEHVVSVYLPLDPEQRDTRLQQARLRTALHDADAALERRGLEPQRRAGLLASLEEATGKLDLATHRDPALALFLSERGLQTMPLPQSLPYSVTAARHANIKPLLPILARQRRFWLLALSTGRARLFSVTPFDCQEIPLELEERNAPSMGAEGQAAREEGETTTVLTDEILRVGQAVKARLGQDPAPLLLAAEPRVSGHFQKLAPLPNLLPEGLALNPFAFPPAELQKRALKAMQPLLENEVQQLLEKIEARLGTAEPTVAIRLEEILHAAEEGRIDALAVAADEAVWGRFGQGTGLQAHGSPRGPDEDLLNQAAVTALRSGARAFALPRERIPRRCAAAALLRY